MSYERNCARCKNGKYCSVRLGVQKLLGSNKILFNIEGDGTPGWKRQIYEAIANACFDFVLWEGRQPWEYWRGCR